MDSDCTALEEMAAAWRRYRRAGVDAVTESSVRAACSAACVAAYPSASGAEHEMDLRRLLTRLVEEYARDDGPAMQGIGTTEAAYDVRRLQAAVRRLRGETP